MRTQKIKKNHKKKIIFCSTIFLVIITGIASLAGITYYRLKKTRIILSGSPVTIEPGASLKEIGKILEQGGIISNIIEFRIWARIIGKDKDIKAGNFSFQGKFSLLDIINNLALGGSCIRIVTIPEGLTVDETADIIFESESDLNLKNTFINFVNVPGQVEFNCSAYGGNIQNLEGFLFPDTYYFDDPPDPKKVILMMLKNFQSKFSDSLAVRCSELGFTPYEILILASIVENEAKLNEERPIIAAIYFNRISSGWLLEADPTIAYAVHKKGQPLTIDDLNIDSPYNTYKYPGLPPTPICSPGIASIMATLYPDTTCKNYYFVADGSGHHIFSKTLDDHNNAIKKIKQNRN
jgi:UPF0755 protein